MTSTINPLYRAPITAVPAVQLAGKNSIPPGAPTESRQRLMVPGNPRAESNRAINAPGRIPVPAPTVTNSPPHQSELSQSDTERLDHLEKIREEVDNSKEIRLLRGAGFLGKKSERSKDIEIERPTVEVVENRPAPPAEINISAKIEQTILLQQRMENQHNAPPKKSDPLALDLDGDGLETTGLAHGVNFDIDADGLTDITSFVSGGDAFLALDLNGNGLIDNGKELFGDQHGDANGYQALAHYDDNSDGIIDNSDAIFHQLRLFSLDGSGEQRLISLDEAGIASISVNYIHREQAIDHYDSIMQHSTFERTDGSTGISGDLLLGYRESS